MSQEIKTELTLPKPSFRIVPNIKTEELGLFDIVLKFSKGMPEAYMHEDVQNVISMLVEQHSEVFLKINWFSDDMTLIVPDTSTNSMHEDTETPTDIPDTSAIEAPSDQSDQAS